MRKFVTRNALKKVIRTQDQVISELSHEVENLVDELFLHHDISMNTTKSLDDMDNTVSTIKDSLKSLVRAQTRSELEWLVSEIAGTLDDITETTKAIKEDLERV